MSKIFNWQILRLWFFSFLLPVFLHAETDAFSPSNRGQPLIFHSTKPLPCSFKKEICKTPFLQHPCEIYQASLERVQEIIASITGANLPASSPNYPFPTHNIYFPGVIKPNHVSQEKMDKVVGSLYQKWKQKYVVHSPHHANQCYISYNQDNTSYPPNAVSVSEGQGFGMIIAAFMAGFDPEGQTLFDNLFRFYRAFPSLLTNPLMGWQQVLVDGELRYGPQGGSNSATDGDLDIAFALLLADKQWGSDQGSDGINYLSHAQTIMSAILSKDINKKESSLKLGDWVQNSDPKYGKATRPSDFMLNHLRNFAAASQASGWTPVINKTYAIINELFANYSPNTGLLPDFSEKIDGAYIPATPNFLERPLDGYYSWNACRTPWRIATDYILSGDPRALAQLTQLNSWIREKTGNTPSEIKIAQGYKLDGTVILGLHYYESLAFATPFAVSAMIDQQNQEWLNDLWTYTSSFSYSNYFGDTIRLLSLIMVSGNWWTPLNLPPSH